MHAYLITGQSIQTEIDKLFKVYSIAPINLLTLTPSPSHGIESIREIIHYLTLQTANKNENRGVLIENAHLMTEAAQNAFLKTLEEPPRDTIIILTAPREDLLLPTIISRCVLINSLISQTSPSAPTAEAELFEKLSSAGIGEKIQFTEKLGKSREEALSFVSDQIAFLHSSLHAPNYPYVPNLTKLLQALLSAYSDLSHNVNPKMVLFELLHHY